ncbi:MAG: hypothetical protein ACJ76F_10615 [Bacteroidia bacterium]
MIDPKKKITVTTVPEESELSTLGLTDDQLQDDQIKSAAEYTINFSDLKDKDLFDEYNPWS